jgi:hypothetical protein
VSEPPRRELSEFLSRPQREPELRDIVVEGPDDAAMISMVIRELGIDSLWRAVSVNELDVPSSMFRPGTDPGAKDRVVRVAEAIFESYGTRAVPIVCVVDLDDDGLLGTQVDNPHLLYFDGCCLESYFLNIEVLRCLIERFLQITLEVEPVAAQLREVLEELFLIRASDRLLELNCGALQADRCCSITGETVRLDTEEHVRRHLSKGGHLGRTDDFGRAMASLRARWDSQGRPYDLLNGHDLKTLIAAVARPLVRDRSLISERAITRALYTCVRLDRISMSPLFTRLGAFCAG